MSEYKKIFHVGLHKTATTFLQNQVFNNLLHTEQITRPYTQHNHAFNMMQYADDTLYDENLFLEEINKFNNKNVIFSDESFSGKPIFFSHINRTMIAKRIKKAVPDAEIILFLRDQKKILYSKYLTYLKYLNGWKSIEDFFYIHKTNYTYEDYKNLKKASLDSLFFNTNGEYINLDIYKYSKIIELYKSLFHKVHIFLYEDLKDNLPETISRLEVIINDKVKVKYFTNVNESFTKKKIFLKRNMNKIASIFNSRIVNKVFSLLFNSVPSFFFKEPENIIEDMVGNYFREDNIKLKQLVKDIK